MHARAPVSGRARAALAVAFLALVAAGIAWTLDGTGDQVAAAARQVPPLAVAAALVPVLGGSLLAMLAWRTVLADMGSRIGIGEASRIFFVGQLGKYAPGAVWPAVAQVGMGTAVGVPPGRMAAACVVNIAISMLTGLTAGLPAGTAVLAGHAWWLAAPAALMGLFVVRPALLRWLLVRGLVLVRQPPAPQHVSTRGLRSCFLLSLAGWAVTGLHLWILAVSLGAPPVGALPLGVGGLAMATVLGSLVVVAPGGLAARELLLVLALSPVLPAPQALAVAIASRLLTLSGEGIVAILAVLAARRRRARRTRLPTRARMARAIEVPRRAQQESIP